MFRVSMFRLCLATRCRCGIKSAPFGLRGVAKVLPEGSHLEFTSVILWFAIFMSKTNKHGFPPQEDLMRRRRTDRSVSSPCRRQSSCLCSSCRSLPTRIGLGPWSGRPCREAQASGFVARASLPLDFARVVLIDQLLVACQTKDSP